ncbi:3-ketosphinganine reductase-like protein [Massarina eburnea CBS 473.64]|uniref:3-dehydrosphinganine reductase n=1 Tax=Massarina eburnea CBS 473.64 TaxID=1395130 RepID=A0A6A6S0A8_9PLEO|nr:3-ketosphinganine reductase-like protein [Massarina eburnea CBS 473.64]
MDSWPIAIAGLFLILVAYFSLDVMGFLSWGNKFPVDGLTVLLTGASQGMGIEVAKLLAQRGANVILVARNLGKLQSAMEETKAAAKDPATQRFHVISADVTIESENARLLKEATSWNDGVVPQVVWANAGSSTPGLFLDCKIETLRSQMDMNYWAATYLAHHTMKAWLYPETPYKPQKKGSIPEPPRHLVFTSSILAFANVTGYSAYSPAKAAMRSLCDGLRMEINLYNGARRGTNNKNGHQPAPFDVVIQSVFPATVLSPGHANEQLTKPAVTKKIEESDVDQSPHDAALGAIKGLEAGNYSTATSFLGDLMRLSAMGGAPRDNIVKDTMGQWLTSWIWLFLGPDWERTVWNWGKTKGMEEYRPNSI